MGTLPPAKAMSGVRFADLVGLLKGVGYHGFQGGKTLGNHTILGFTSPQSRVAQPGSGGNT